MLVIKSYALMGMGSMLMDILPNNAFSISCCDVVDKQDSIDETCSLDLSDEQNSKSSCDGCDSGKCLSCSCCHAPVLAHNWFLLQFDRINWVKDIFTYTDNYINTNLSDFWHPPQLA